MSDYMNYYYVTFSNGWGRKNVYATSPQEAQKKAEREIPVQWANDDVVVVDVETQDGKM